MKLVTHNFDLET